MHTKCMSVRQCIVCIHDLLTWRAILIETAYLGGAPGAAHLQELCRGRLAVASDGGVDDVAQPLLARAGP